MTRRGVVKALVVAAVLVVGGLWMMDSVVRSMLYPAPPGRPPSPPPSPLVEVQLEAGGRAVSAWYLPPAADATTAPVVLWLHGNGENLETMRQGGLFADLSTSSVGVLAIDYPGYGRSAGTPSETANLAAAEAAWQWMLQHRDGRPLVIAGWSLGAGVAAQLAAAHRDEVAGVMLLSAWDRLDAVARLHFPGWMVGALLSDRYDSIAAAPRIGGPTLVVHGDRDTIIPVELGRHLFAALPDPKQWAEVPGAGHNDLLSRPEAWQAIQAFLSHPGELDPVDRKRHL
ncbi:MAG TPA: alpha/beta hydrolase [Thermoanaerobaculia bacterium]|nr:alpha/beta hydrolase [Thermoanaerobaculia bacterium]